LEKRCRTSGKFEMKVMRKLEGGRVRIRQRSRRVEEMATNDGPEYSDVYHSAAARTFLPK